MMIKQRQDGKDFMSNPIPGVVGKDTALDLALDVSSSCVGWAVGINRSELVVYGKFVFTSGAGIGEKLLAFERWFRALLEHYRPCRLLIEKPLSRRGNVTQRHNELMGVIRKLYREVMGGEVLDAWWISPITIKRVMNVKRGNAHWENKLYMVNKINELYGLGLSFHRWSKHKSDDDAADAIAVLTTFWRQNATSSSPGGGE